MPEISGQSNPIEAALRLNFVASRSAGIAREIPLRSDCLSPSPGKAPFFKASAFLRAEALKKGALPGEGRSEEHTSELQSHVNLVCRLLLEKKKKNSSYRST